MCKNSKEDTLGNNALQYDSRLEPLFSELLMLAHSQRDCEFACQTCETTTAIEMSEFKRDLAAVARLKNLLYACKELI